MLAKTPIENFIFDKDEIIGFLESKDPNEKYDYVLPYDCAFAQFLTAHNIDPKGFYDQRHRSTPPGVWHRIVLKNGKEKVSTYGEALARAKELLK